jgi:hypothetical protein
MECMLLRDEVFPSSKLAIVAIADSPSPGAAHRLAIGKTLTYDAK